MYLEYLDWLKNVFPPTEDYRHIYEGISEIPWYGEIEVITRNMTTFLRHPSTLIIQLLVNGFKLLNSVNGELIVLTKLS
jgi:hypothetical protein